MRRLIIIPVLAALAGCDGPIPSYIDGKTVRDKTGCVFIASKHIGDTVFLRPVPDMSDQTCRFQMAAK